MFINFADVCRLSMEFCRYYHLGTLEGARQRSIIDFHCVFSLVFLPLEGIEESMRGSRAPKSIQHRLKCDFQANNHFLIDVGCVSIDVFPRLGDPRGSKILLLSALRRAWENPWAPKSIQNPLKCAFEANIDFLIDFGLILVDFSPRLGELWGSNVLPKSIKQKA